MAWVIMKAWKRAPDYWQRATLKIHPTRTLAEERRLKLVRLFPGRIFKVEELENTSSEGSD